jgi:hypothetical protein
MQCKQRETNTSQGLERGPMLVIPRRSPNDQYWIWLGRKSMNFYFAMNKHVGTMYVCLIIYTVRTQSQYCAQVNFYRSVSYGTSDI